MPNMQMLRYHATQVALGQAQDALITHDIIDEGDVFTR
jgi:hypothetical protein